MRFLIGFNLTMCLSLASNPLLNKPATLFELGMMKIENELKGYMNESSSVMVFYKSDSSGNEELQINFSTGERESSKEYALHEALSTIKTFHRGWKSRGHFSFGEHLTFLKYFIPESGRKIDSTFIEETEKWLLKHTRIWVKALYGKESNPKWVMCEAWLKDKNIKKCWDENLRDVKANLSYD